MTPQGDPYRTLGVVPGASLNEIKSAYRRLAKQYHPDTAGERALSRFLAIQAAYERLVDGEGRLRPAAGRRAAADPWPAGATRPRASRDAWRARRSGGSSAAEPGAGAAGDAGPAAEPGARKGRGSGPRGQGRPGEDAAGAGGDPGGPDRAHSGRGPRKATPGSTTYDEATEMPLDPEWEGGTWYGPSSGTYWTLNPREYADPRKHGPEYLARARRAAAGAEPPPGEDPAAEMDPATAARTRHGGDRRPT
jgi:curved DNA-binding protein CbpA